MKSGTFKKAMLAIHLVSLKCVLLLLLLLSFFSTAYSGNFTVNSITQFQAALNTSAANGEHDTITVLAGTYNVNPTLTYSSSENYSILIRGTGSPVFDGGNSRRIIQLTSLAGNGDVYIEGLTIQHGRADYGGGLNVLTQTADIRITNCTATDNTANFVAGGGNLFSNTGNITVTNCFFRRNSSPNTSGYPYGTAGGLFVQTDGVGTIITLSGCTFELNTAERDAAGAMLYPLGLGSAVIAEFNTFINNTAKEFGGGCWVRAPGCNTALRYNNNTVNGNSAFVAGSGGGTYIQITSGTIDMFDNVHSGNNASWQGGGLWIEHGGGTLNLHRNRFSGNSAVQSGGGANLYLESGTSKVDHNLFYDNQTPGAGGGLSLSTSTGLLRIFNNTLFSNSAGEGGDVYLYFDNSSAVAYFYNNILYNSTVPSLSFSGMQTVTAKYSDIKGGIGQPWFGTGCMDRYPFFADTAAGNFHLQDSIHCSNQRFSPCIDSGDPALTDSINSCSMGLGQSRSDMGAYGGKDSITIGIKKINSNVAAQFVLYQNYPNPFNPVKKIKFNIALDSRLRGNDKSGVIFKVYDILGHEVQTLVNKQLSPGTYEVEWDGMDFPSGVYYYTLTAGEFKETKKMVLIK